MDLVFHIGLHKTATTTLQMHFFPHLSYSFTAHHGGEKALKVRSIFRDYFQGDGNSVWPDDLQLFLEALVREGAERALVSDEYLSVWLKTEMPGRGRGRYFVEDKGIKGVSGKPPKGEGHDPLLVLLNVCNALESIRRVRVIVVLREQAEWLTSLYSERMHRSIRPGQKDFENQVRQLISGNHPVLDYASFVRQLSTALGKSNLLELLHEDGLTHNVRKMESFIGEGLGTQDAANFVENKKRSGDKTWDRSEIVPISQSGKVGRLRRFLWSIIPPSLRGFVAPVRSCVKCLDELFLKIGMKGKGSNPPVTLTKAIQEEVHAHCRETNRTLAGFLGRDLQALGYGV